MPHAKLKVRLPNLSESLFQVSDIVLAWLKVESSHGQGHVALSRGNFSLTAYRICAPSWLLRLPVQTARQVSAPLLPPSPSNHTTPTPQGSSSIHHFQSWLFVKLGVTLPPTVKSSPSYTQFTIISLTSGPTSTLSLLLQLC